MDRYEEFQQSGFYKAFEKVKEKITMKKQIFLEMPIYKLTKNFEG